MCTPALFRRKKAGHCGSVAETHRDRSFSFEGQREKAAVVNHDADVMVQKSR